MVQKSRMKKTIVQGKSYLPHAILAVAIVLSLQRRLTQIKLAFGKEAML